MSFNSIGPSDAVVVCCSYDLRVCDFACNLIQDRLAPALLFTGRAGNWTKRLWDRPEAHVFKERALANGIGDAQILVEDRATNIGENLAYSKAMLPDAKSVTFVTKPNTLLRVKLTAPIRWPGVSFFTAGPQFKFPEEVSNVIGLSGLINEMVGDIQRIREYPKLGYQVEHLLPEEILNSWNYLIEQGFTAHLQ